MLKHHIFAKMEKYVVVMHMLLIHNGQEILIALLKRVVTYLLMRTQ